MNDNAHFERPLSKFFINGTGFIFLMLLFFFTVIDIITRIQPVIGFAKF